MKINIPSKQNHSPEEVKAINSFPKYLLSTYNRPGTTQSRHNSNEEATVLILRENLAKLKYDDARSLAPNNFKRKRIQFTLCFWVISLSNKS